MSLLSEMTKFLSPILPLMLVCCLAAWATGQSVCQGAIKGKKYDISPLSAKTQVCLPPLRLLLLFCIACFFFSHLQGCQNVTWDQYVATYTPCVPMTVWPLPVPLDVKRM